MMRETLTVLGIIGGIVVSVLVFHGIVWALGRSGPSRPTSETAFRESQSRAVWRTGKAFADGEIDGSTAAAVLIAIGPIKGSYADHSGTRCHHMLAYPGCRGGCQ